MNGLRSNPGPGLATRALVLATTLGLGGVALAGGMGGGAGGGGVAAGSGGSAVGGAGTAGRGTSGGFEGGTQRDATARPREGGVRGGSADDFIGLDPASERDRDGDDAAAAGDTAHTFNGADADRDSRLTADEFGDFRRRNEGVSADADLSVNAENERLFRDLDLDGDGRLSADEATGPAAE